MQISVISGSLSGLSGSISRPPAADVLDGAEGFGNGFLAAQSVDNAS